MVRTMVYHRDKCWILIPSNQIESNHRHEKRGSTQLYKTGKMEWYIKLNLQKLFVLCGEMYIINREGKDSGLTVLSRCGTKFC